MKVISGHSCHSSIEENSPFYIHKPFPRTVDAEFIEKEELKGLERGRDSGI
jgi:hypothetical protein